MIYPLCTGQRLREIRRELRLREQDTAQILVLLMNRLDPLLQGLLLALDVGQ